MRFHLKVAVTVAAAGSLALVFSTAGMWQPGLAKVREVVIRASDREPAAVAVGLVVCIALFITVLIPSTPIELVVAYIYGLGRGFALVYTGKVIGCLASYVLGRSGCRGLRARILKRHRLLRALALAVNREPWRICLLARAAYIPIAIKNYGFAALSAPPLPYVVTLLLVEMYNTFEMVFIGVSVQRVGDVAAESDGDGGSSQSHDAWVSAAGTAVAATCLVGLGCYGAVATRRALDALQIQEAGVDALPAVPPWTSPPSGGAAVSAPAAVVVELSSCGSCATCSTNSTTVGAAAFTDLRIQKMHANAGAAGSSYSYLAEEET